MTLREYVKVLKGWLLLAGLVLGLLAAGAITWFSTPTYSTSTTLYVSAQGFEGDLTKAYQGSLLSVEKVKSYAELIAGERIRSEVDDRLGIEIEPGQITGSAVPETVLITATATDPSPERARQIANAVGAEFTALLNELERPAAVDGPALVVARVVQPAPLPTQPSAPRPELALPVGAVLGLVLGYSAALVRYTMDTSPKSIDDLRRVTGAPVLGRIAFSARLRRRPLLAHHEPRGPEAESFRQLRTNLQFLDKNETRGTVVVTSTVPGEGATTTACNLAVVLAQAGRRVLLVEADLRQPSAATYLGVEPSTGLTEVLSGDAPLDDALYNCAGPEIALLPSGALPLNPSELLGSERMGELLDEMAARYDVVLIDAPPLLPVPDASALAARSDGVLLVVRHGRTPKNTLSVAIAALDTVSARLLGTVLNMATDARAADRSSYSSKGGSRFMRAFAPDPRQASDDVEREPALLGAGTSSGASGPRTQGAPAYRGAAADDRGANGSSPPSGATRPPPRPRL